MSISFVIHLIMMSINKPFTSFQFMHTYYKSLEFVLHILHCYMYINASNKQHNISSIILVLNYNYSSIST